MEQLSKDNLRTLQSNQLSVALFCSSLISAVAPLLLGHLNRDFPWLTSTNKPGSSLTTVSASFVYKCLLLLESVVEIMELEWAAHTEHVQTIEHTGHVQTLEHTEHVQDPRGRDVVEDSDIKVSSYLIIICKVLTFSMYISWRIASLTSL